MTSAAQPGEHHDDGPDSSPLTAGVAPGDTGHAGEDAAAAELIRHLRRAESLHRSLIENLPGTSVFLLDSELRILLAQGGAMRKLPWFRDDGFLGQVITALGGSVPSHVLDAAVDNFRAAFEGRTRDFEFESEGCTFAMRVVPVSGTEGAVEAVLVMANDVTTLRRAELELARRVSQQETVARLGELALRERDVDALLAEVVEAVGGRLGMEFCGLLELEPENRALRLVAGRGWDHRLVGSVWVSADRDSQAAYTLSSSAPVIVEDFRRERRFAPSPRVIEGGMVSGISVVVGGRERPFGVLGAHSRMARKLSTDDVNFLTAVAHLVAVAVERRRDEQRTLHAALHDPLTGLPNRTLVMDRLEQALARRSRVGGEVATLMLDLDGFKVINDSLGHGAGDEVLLALAPRLRSALRPSDTVGRLGGDEFVAICEVGDDPAEAVAIAERMVAAASEPFAMESGRHHLTASVGIAIATGRDETPGSMIRDADAAMYRAKSRGRGGCELFDDTMREHVLARLRTEAELRRALGRGELRVHYQPIVDVSDGRPAAVEALVRWEHPERGLVPPGEFIPVAEETGLIVDIGRWVLEASCGQVAAWQAELGIDLHLSVNVSGRQIADPGFAAEVAAIARRHRLQPGTLALEITESVLIGEGEAPLTELSTLHDHGLRLELDDFGTGYSSLSYLKRFPLDGLKIDRSFLEGIGSDPRAAAIVEAVVRMALALEVDVVTEGVETDAQLSALRALGCRRAQGFLFSRPLPADAMGRRLARASAERR